MSAKAKKPAQSAQEIVTTQIIELLKEFKEKPELKADQKTTLGWLYFGSSPKNHKTDVRYNGINHLLLALKAYKKGYHVHRWLTFKQAQEMGYQVKKGEKGTTAIYYNRFKKYIDPSKLTPEQLKDAEKDDNGKYFIMKAFAKVFYVFNIAQLDASSFPSASDTHAQKLGLMWENDELVSKLPPVLTTFSENEKAQAIIAKAFDDITIYHISDDDDIPNAIANGASKREIFTNEAYYTPDSDRIYMPRRDMFYSENSYYATLFHELTHATAHVKRLNRKVDNKAFEELIAELGSAFLMNEIDCLPDTVLGHASYLDYWLQDLENDPSYIFKASAQAQKACDYILEHYAGVKRPSYDDDSAGE